jgi:hypothetical protein
VDSRSGGRLLDKKEALCTAAILAYKLPRERFVVYNDVSNRIEGVVSQVQGGQERVTAYYSKTLNRA